RQLRFQLSQFGREVPTCQLLLLGNYPRQFMTLRASRGRVCALIVFFSSGRRHTRSRLTEIVIPRPCVLEVRLTQKTECHGPDRKHLSCTDLVMVVKPKCEEIRVK